MFSAASSSGGGGVSGTRALRNYLLPSLAFATVWTLQTAGQTRRCRSLLCSTAAFGGRGVSQRDLMPRRRRGPVSLSALQTPSSLDLVEQRNVSMDAISPAPTDSTKAEPINNSKVPKNFVSGPFAYHEQVDVRVESLTNLGWGVGRVGLTEEQRECIEQQDNECSSDDPQPPRRRKRRRRRRRSEDDAEEPPANPDRPWVIMVPNVIPGELIRCEIFRNYKSYSHGQVVEIIEPSKDRVEPVCGLAEECGGCQLQHMGITAQRQWKSDAVTDAVRQFGLLDGSFAVSTCAGTNEIYGYRSKITPHFQAPASSRCGVVEAMPSQHIQAVGFQKQTSRQTVDVESCPIATTAVNAKYQEVRQVLLSQPTARKTGATLLFRQADLVEEGEEAIVSVDHKEYVTTTVNGLKFTYKAGNFFQNNYYVLPLMVDHVVQGAVGGSGDDDDRRIMTHLVDCYCGSGLLALSCAKHFEIVVGIEINDKAVKEAEANAAQNGITNCQFEAASAEHIFDDLGNFPVDETVVIIDPPRKGCSPAFLKQLQKFAPSRLVYLSCDPTTQARDAAVLVQGGRATDRESPDCGNEDGSTGATYRITTVQPFDLFPQTRHVECLMVLEKNVSEENQ